MKAKIKPKLAHTLRSWTCHHGLSAKSSWIKQSYQYSTKSFPTATWASHHWLRYISQQHMRKTESAGAKEAFRARRDCPLTAGWTFCFPLISLQSWPAFTSDVWLNAGQSRSFDMPCPTTLLFLLFEMTHPIWWGSWMIPCSPPLTPEVQIYMIQIWCADTRLLDESGAWSTQPNAAVMDRWWGLMDNIPTDKVMFTNE